MPWEMEHAVGLSSRRLFAVDAASIRVFHIQFS